MSTASIHHTAPGGRFSVALYADSEKLHSADGRQTVTLLVNGEHCDGRVAISRDDEKAGVVTPPHVHLVDDEIIYVQSGRVEFRVDGQTVVAGPRTLVQAGPHVNRGFTALEDSELVFFNTPGGHAEPFTRGVVALAGPPPPGFIEGLTAKHQIRSAAPADEVVDLPNKRLKVVKVEDAESYKSPTGRTALLLTGEETDGRLFITHNIIEAGGGAPYHYHDHDDEFFYVVSGRLVGAVGAQKAEVGPGDVLHAGPTVVRGFTAVEDSEVLTITAPGGISEQFVRGMLKLGRKPTTEEVMTIGGRSGIHH